MRKISFKKIIPVLLFAIITLSCFTVNAEETTQVVKVGYTLNNGTIKSPMVIGAEGYGYEYLNKIFKYIDGSYTLEFVYCEYTEVEELLASGEIDLYGPVAYTESMGENFLFTEESFGDNFVFLSTLNTNENFYSNIDNIDGSTIAVQLNEPNEYLLDEFLEENNLEANIVYFTESDYETVMETNGYDFCLCTSLQTYQNLTPVVSLGYTESYYISCCNNVDLIDDINEAMVEVHEQEYLYQEKLYLEYYDYSILSDSYITEEEYALLQGQDIYYIGIEDIYGPIGYKNDDGEFQGVSVDVMNMIADIAGIEYVFVEVTEDTTQEEMEALDFSFLSYDENGRENTVESTPFCEMPYILVDRIVEEDETITQVGVMVHYGLTEDAYTGYIHEREIVEYDSLLAMLEAYNNGEIDSIIMTTSNMNLVKNEFVDQEFVVTNLDMSLNLCLIFQENYSEEKMLVFDKIINQLDAKAIESSVMTYSTPESTEVGVKELMKKYPFAIPSIIIVVAAVIILVIVVLSDRRKNHLYQLLNYDKLTGLYSGHKFEAEVEKVLSLNDKYKYSIVTIDIDHFKYINDVFGYEVGNVVIQKVASSIREISPQSVVVARNNSDIFLVLLRREANEDHRLEFTDEDRRKLFGGLKPYIGDTYRLSFSIGVYDIMDKTFDINFMIDCANIARLQGKRFVHTTIYQYDSHLDSKRMVSTDLIQNMVQAIQEHEFVVYYQPKISLENKKITGAEALVRWMKNGEMIPPNQFIPLFEKNGFIESLDIYVLEEVCVFLKENPKAPKISVNISGATIIKPDITKRIFRVVDKYEVDYKRIEIEITESAFVDEFENVLHAIERLREKGFTIAMDDFGVGISSLSRLKNIPLDVLKIDREFIWDSMNNEKGLEIVKNVIRMAIGLNLETVAEGVETQSQEKMLLELGCDIGQGYNYSRPLPKEKFIQWF